LNPACLRKRLALIISCFVFSVQYGVLVRVILWQSTMHTSDAMLNTQSLGAYATLDVCDAIL